MLRFLYLLASTLFFSGVSAQLAFGPEQLIAAQSGVVTVYSGDFNNDGHIDLLSTATIAGTSWWENDGAGNFTLGQYLEPNGDVPLCKAAAIFDYDNDNDLDVLAVINTEAATSPTSVQYFENTGGGVFSGGVTVGFVGVNAQEIIPADLDGDGDMDAVFAESSQDQIGWLEYDNNTWSAPVILNTLANGAQTVTCADFDQDGDIDIMGAGEYDDEWVWYPNDGNQNFTTEEFIASGDNVSSVFHTDLDGDGFPDGLAVYGIDGDVLWVENAGDGTGFNSPQFLLDGNGFPDNFPITIEAFDLDQDGDLDPVTCSILDDTINWFENLGGGSFAAQQTLATGADNVRQVAFGDFDEDGDVDIAAANFGANDLVWYENTSSLSQFGCTDPTACNFDPAAEVDDGSCDFSCYGCTDPGACNFDPSFTIDDGSCDYSCLGCTDPLACNFDETATIDDGSCIVIEAFTLTWGGPISFCIGDGEENLFDPGVENNGNSGANQRFLVVSDNGTILSVSNSFFLDLETLSPGIYSFYAISYEDGVTGLSEGALLVELDGCYDLSNVINLTLDPGGCTDPGACNFDPAAVCSLPICTFDCNGCTNPDACNFSPDATQDDGSCDYYSCVGCTNSFAINYDPAALADDGSCILPSQVCGAGTYWDSDAQQCLSVEEPVCPGDFDGNLIINSADLLMFLVAFGGSCD